MAGILALAPLGTTILYLAGRSGDPPRYLNKKCRLTQIQQLFEHEGQLKHIMILYQLPLTRSATRRARLLDIYHLVTCSHLQYDLSAPSAQLAAKWA